MATVAGPRYARLDGCVDRWWRDRVLLVAPDGEAHELAGGAGIIWMVLDDAGTAADIRDRVGLLVAAEPTPPLAEVEATLGLLVAAGLVTTTE